MIYTYVFFWLCFTDLQKFENNYMSMIQEDFKKAKIKN